MIASKDMQISYRQHRLLICIVKINIKVDSMGDRVHLNVNLLLEHY